MKTQKFSQLISYIGQLTHAQKKKLLVHLKRDTNSSESISVIETTFENTQICPHCKSGNIIRWGSASKLQRYRCKECDKTFNALTNSALARLRHKDKWSTYSQCLSDNETIRKSATKCEVNKTTSFRWRHRFLQVSAQAATIKMSGIVEADETFFTNSDKGNRHLNRKSRKRGKSNKREINERVPVLIVRDRNGAVADFIFDQVEKEKIHQSLKLLVDQENVLCTDGSSIYQAFAEKESIPHKRVIASSNIRVIDKIFHIQNLNAYTSRLKTWLLPFNGVSTRYLQNYLGWRRLIEARKAESGENYFLSRALGRQFTNN